MLCVPLYLFERKIGRIRQPKTKKICCVFYISDGNMRNLTIFFWWRKKLFFHNWHFFPNQHKLMLCCKKKEKKSMWLFSYSSFLWIQKYVYWISKELNNFQKSVPNVLLKLFLCRTMTTTTTTNLVNLNAHVITHTVLKL